MSFYVSTQRCPTREYWAKCRWTKAGVSSSCRCKSKRRRRNKHWIRWSSSLYKYKCRYIYPSLPKTIKTTVFSLKTVSRFDLTYFCNHAQSRFTTLFLHHSHTSVVTAPCQKDPKGSSSPPVSCPDQDSTETSLWWICCHPTVPKGLMFFLLSPTWWPRFFLRDR